jgi:hypothetical protein
MPRKTFTAGEVLAAADVNEYLMDQSVMTFADSGARGSAIGTAIAQEGMLTYLEDTDAFEYWDGSAFTAFGGGGGAATNAIINGAFEINQRNYASAGTLASGAYGFDRWKANAADTTLTFTPAPQGQEITINDTKGIKQIIERANLPAGTYTLSFSGTATGRIYNTGATPPSYAASPITVTLDGLANVEVEFTASGGAKTLSNVQLEAGSTATPFRRNANSVQGELAACQRYYFQTTQDVGQTGIGFGQSSSTTAAIGYINLPVRMRTTPTSVSFSTLVVYDGSTFYAVSALTIRTQFTSPNMMAVDVVSTGLTNFRPYLLSAQTTAGFVGISAEL